MDLFIHNLNNVDFSYLHPQRGLVGETWLVNVTLRGELDAQGMILDFGVFKKTLRQWFDEHIDHKLLIPSESHQLTLGLTEKAIALEWLYGDQGHEKYILSCQCPQQAITSIETADISAKSVNEWCVSKLSKLLNCSEDQLEIALEVEKIEEAYYHYSHGLKKHAGNCQRIAHGHRSRLEITIDGLRDKKLEEQWCKRFKDIYIGTREDLQSKAPENLEQLNNSLDQNDCYQFHYASSQGEFFLSLPKTQCYLLDTESTVENIARHLCQQIASDQPDTLVKVKAFEGLGKGAIESCLNTSIKGSYLIST